MKGEAVMNSSMKAIIRDTAIVMGLTFLGGAVIGLANPASNNMAAIASSNFIFSTLGFFIAGCLTRFSRFNHLIKVVFAVWFVSLINVAFFGVTPANWAAGIVFHFITMGIGGGLSLLVVRQQKVENS